MDYTSDLGRMMNEFLIPRKMVGDVTDGVAVKPPENWGTQPINHTLKPRSFAVSSVQGHVL